MRTKLLATLFSLVLICACVAGMMMLSAQAEGTTYEWVVNGQTTDTTDSNPNKWSFSSIDKAIQYAKSQTAFTWEKDDQLIIHIAAKDTAAATASTRLLFNTKSVFRTDHTLLPITIDGDDPATASVERNGFALNGTGYINTSDNKNYGVACGNSYCFKGMDLNWGANTINFRAGAGQVTFDDVTFGGDKIQLSADATSSAMFGDWTANNFNAMKNSEGVYEITITLKNLTYTGSATNLVSARNWSSGFTVSSASFSVANTRSKLVIGSGAKVSNVSIVATAVTEPVASDAYCLSIEGGTVTTVYGVRSTSTAYGNIITKISSGTVTNFCPGPNTGTLHGNVTNTVTGGSVTGKYRGGSISTGTINGDITNYAYGGTLAECRFGSENGVINGDVINYLGTADKSKTFNSSGFVGGNHSGGAINGDIINHMYSAKLTATYYCGSRMGLVENVVNYFYDGFDASTVANAYCGGNSASNGGAIKYSITNNFKGGSFGSHLYCGSANTAWATLESNEKAPEYRIVNNVEGGTFYRLYCAGNGKGVTDGAVQNNFSGKIKANVAICGGCDNTSSITVKEIENHFAAEFTGAATVYGGSMNGAVGTITNTFDGPSFATTVYGGSNTGVVEFISNTVNSGIFDGTYFVCGNNQATFATVTGDTAATVRIANDINGGTFKRVVGGSFNADVNGSILSDYDTAITAKVAVYAGNASGGDIIGTVTNNINGIASVDGKSTIRVFYGGNNNGGGIIGAIVNNFKGGSLRSVYGGCNYEGKPESITNTVTGGVFGCEYAFEEDNETVYFTGGNRVADLTCDVNTTVKGGTLINVLAGTLSGNDSGKVKLTLAPEGALAILGKAYGITGAVSDEANPIGIGRDSYLSFADARDSEAIFVQQQEAWDEDCYVSLPASQSTIGWSNAEGVTGAPVSTVRGENTYLMYGNPAMIDAVSLVLTDRIAIKAYFEKDAVSDELSYSFTILAGTVFAEGTKADLTLEGEYYTVILPAIGLADFEKPFLLSGTSIQTVDMSVISLADLGAAYYAAKDAKAEKLFQSIADLGRSANGTEPVYNLTAEAVSYTPSGATVKGGTDEVEVKSVALLMSNAVGISLRGTAASAEPSLDVFVNGQKVTDFCGISVSEEKNSDEKYEFSADLYISVSAMSKELKIEMKSGDGSETYLETYLRTDDIAKKIGSDLAEDLLIYIQAATAYKA